MKKYLSLLLFVLFMLLPFSQGRALSNLSEIDIAQAESMVMSKINKIRTEGGVSPLVRISALDAYAKEWSECQAAKSQYFHRDWNTMQTAIPGVTKMGENVLMWEVDYMENLEQFVQEGVGWWNNSPPHHRNMTNPDFNVERLGIVYRGGVFYVTLNLGYAPNLDKVGSIEMNQEREPKIEQEEVLDKEKQWAQEVEEKMISLSSMGKVVPGLNYQSFSGAKDEYRALLGDGIIVEGRNDVLNGAIKLKIDHKSKGKMQVTLINAQGEEVHSLGIAKIYVYIPESRTKSIVVKQDGVKMHLANEKGTDFVSYFAEL